MIRPAPPYFLTGQSGRTLPAAPHPFAAANGSGLLTRRALGPDVLTFSLRAATTALPIPDDGQWLTLTDDTGTVLFTGICQRRFRYRAGLYEFTASNAYQALIETPLIAAGRPYLAVPAQHLGITLRDLLSRAQAAGVPLQPPAPEDLPGYPAPKMAFKSVSWAEALEKVCKWLPHVTTRTDYSTSPPTLRFYARNPATATVLDLDADGHGVTDFDLAAMPEARALSIAFAYAEREGESAVNYRLQTAGDDTAEARRKISIYLSGPERMDMMVSEAVMSGNRAIATANASLAAANAAIEAVNAAAAAEYAAAIAAIPGTGDSFDAMAYIIAQDAAVAASSLYWQYAGYRSGYPSTSWGLGTPDTYVETYYKTPLTYSHGGWPVVGNPFSPAQLAAAGATATPGTLAGNIAANVGHGSLQGFPYWCSYYGSGHYVSSEYAEADWVKYVYHPVSLPLTFLSMAPSSIRAALTTQATTILSGTTVTPATGDSRLIERAEFVEAPADLALNYFTAQDWLPYRGRLAMTPKAATLAMPGDFVSLCGTGVPPEYQTMAAPVAETQLALAAGTAEVTLGPPARADYRSLLDRLYIPEADNYEAG